MHRVIVEKGYLSFSAAHFISFMGKCERMHGHNYAVSVELEGGGLTEDAYVFDFVALKRIARGICDALDHRFLLPERSEAFDVRRGEDEWEIRYQDRRYVLPAPDVLSLPVDSITAERLAEHICARLLEALAEHEVSHLTAVTVGVEEAPGQTAYYRHSFTRDQPR
ncbi:MAG: 6-pyruvoyl tetrahydropterin synthase family protein [Chloroflexota bacterium]|nr:6-pyruvoyl tetrahydropterin synthase family protein [Chloroflexota bacterium]